METLTVGSKAYLDSFSGLIPCKVSAISGETGMANSSQHVTVILSRSLKTSSGVWKAGEVIEQSALWVVPRKSVHIRCGQYRIRPYNVAVA